MIENYEVITRLVLALVLGALLGIERIHARKIAGVRTFALVSLGSALFIIISEQVIARYGFEIDPLRVAANLVTGIGFLGAGMIVFRENHVSNLTTAAGMWLSAGIGAAVGFGLYLESITVSVLVVITFTLMLSFENYLKRKFFKYEKDFELEDIEK